MSDKITQIRKALEGATPGPWHSENDHPLNACATVFCKHANGWKLEIATLYHAPGDKASQDDNGMWGPHTKRDCNARLIALAPDMARIVLAAEELAEVAQRAIQLSQEHEDFALYAMEPMWQALAAYRKAVEGEK